MNILYSALASRALDAPGDSLLESAEGQLDAASLLQRLESACRWLKAHSPTTVALLADNSIDWVIADLAAQFAGVRLVPLPPFFSSGQLAHSLRAAAVDLLLVEPELIPCVPGNAGTGERVADLGSLAAFRYPCQRQASMPRDTARITFTSGTTGTPKGVCLSTTQCLAVARALADTVEIRRPRHLCLLPLSTLLENLGGVYMPLLANGSVVLRTRAELGMSGSSGLHEARLLEAIDSVSPQTLILTPQLLLCLEAAAAAGWNPPASLRFVAVGGGRVDPAVIQRARDQGLPVYEGYGLSESASVVSLNVPGADRVGSTGRVLPHVRVRVRENRVLVSGNAFLGYLDQPGSWHRDEVDTGDLGSIDAEGFLTITGRSRNVMISSFGRNISPEWVEAELLASGSILQAVLIGDQRPWCSALLWPAGGLNVTAAINATIDRVNAGLPDYARVRQWHLLDEPLSIGNGLLTANGRPRRDAIARHYAQEIDWIYRKQQDKAS
ncbi:AMP-binding protein [Haliea sp. E17]|uniref:AMP-binding protein n=1 Tax=Haliea sp. E17 TaxID=3401576 RepID=UPI003AAEBB4B